MNLLDLHLGRPVHRGSLTLFPVWNGRAVATRGYVLADGVVEVAEREGSAVVAQLVVTNPGARPALVLEGDLLEGGQQDRVANRSILVPAQRAEVLDVSCVEQGRWHGERSQRRSGYNAPIEIRAAARRDQQQVWASVGRYSARFGGDESGSLRHAAGQARSHAAAVVADLEPLPFQAGILIGLAGQPLMLETFDSHRTLRHQWRALLDAAALSSLSAASDEPTPGRRARRFLERLGQTQVEVAGGAGAGRELTARSAHVDLRGLLWHQRAVHTVALNPRHELVSA